MPRGNEPEVNPNIALTKMAREIRREHWRNEFDFGNYKKTTLTRKAWVDNKLREEGLL